MNGSTVAALLVGLVVLTAAIRAVGPVLFGGRDLGPRVGGMVALFAPALLAALVVTQTFADGDRLELDWRCPAVIAAGVAAWRDVPPVLCMVLAAAVAALGRWIG